MVQERLQMSSGRFEDRPWWTGLPRATPITFSLSRMLGFVSATVITGVRDEKRVGDSAQVKLGSRSRGVQWTRLSAGPFSKREKGRTHTLIRSVNGPVPGSHTTVKHVTLQPGQLRI